ncbi:TetR/AcrR family transcriptional regulator [Sphingomonas sp. GlSt437]|uniref:TetR/AcrR family transcriptional regulator n=1 Tax=Sphingomonas sp. GlSt437 TaxID=3389970 RepID=UPI003A85ECD3
MSIAADPKRYHHGELRAALIAAALEALERDGPAALSLRGLARAIGVSPMAPYHHFADRAALLAAVAAAGFERLQQRKLAVQADAGDDPAEALVAGSASYVAFVLDNPNLYRLMKGPEFAEPSRYPELQRAAAAPAETLLAMIGRLIEERGLPGLDPAACAVELWALAHGAGTLALDGQLTRDQAEHAAREGARSMIKGWLVA